MCNAYLVNQNVQVADKCGIIMSHKQYEQHLECNGYLEKTSLVYAVPDLMKEVEQVNLGLHEMKEELAMVKIGMDEMKNKQLGKNLLYSVVVFVGLIIVWIVLTK